MAMAKLRAGLVRLSDFHRFQEILELLEAADFLDHAEHFVKATESDALRSAAKACCFCLPNISPLCSVR